VENQFGQMSDEIGEEISLPTAPASCEASLIMMDTELP